MKDAISPILSKNEPARSSTERYRQAAIKATEILAERDKEEETKAFGEKISYQVVNQYDRYGAEDRATFGLKR